MPIFMDRYDVVEFSAEEIAKLHVKDLEIRDLVFKPTGSETLKGFSEPVQLFSPVSREACSASDNARTSSP